MGQREEGHLPSPYRWLHRVGWLAVALVLAVALGHRAWLRAVSPPWAVVWDLAPPGRSEEILWRDFRVDQAGGPERESSAADPWGTPYRLGVRDEAILFVDGLELVTISGAYPDRVLRSAGPNRVHEDEGFGDNGDDVLVHAGGDRPPWLRLLSGSPWLLTLALLLLIAWSVRAPWLSAARRPLLREGVAAAGYALPVMLSLGWLSLQSHESGLAALGYSKASVVLTLCVGVWVYFLAVRLGLSPDPPGEVSP